MEDEIQDDCPRCDGYGFVDQRHRDPIASPLPCSCPAGIVWATGRDQGEVRLRAENERLRAKNAQLRAALELVRPNPLADWERISEQAPESTSSALVLTAREKWAIVQALRPEE